MALVAFSLFLLEAVFAFYLLGGGGWNDLSELYSDEARASSE